MIDHNINFVNLLAVVCHWLLTEALEIHPCCRTSELRNPVHSTQGPCPARGAATSCRLDRVRRAAVFRGFLAFAHAVVADYARNPQTIVSEHLRAPANLRFTVAAEVAPAPHRVLVAPERERQELALVRKARETLDRDESVDSLELRPQPRRKIEILLFLARSRKDFEYHHDHVVLAS